MQELDKALGDIQSIRRQMARTAEFRGYGPATVATTAAIAIVASGAQTKLVPDPANHITAYLSIWIPAAVVSAALAGAQMYTRSRRIHSGMSDEMIRMAVEQFLPSVGASYSQPLCCCATFRVRCGCFPEYGNSFLAWVCFRLVAFCRVPCSQRALGTC